MDDTKLIKDSKNRRKRRAIRRIIILLLIMVLIAIMFVYCTNKLAETAKTAVTEVTRQAETTVREGNYTSKIDISGSLEPYESQDVVAKIDGTVEDVYVSEGDHVTKGQLLVSLEDSEQVYNVENARLKIEEARIIGNASARELELMEKQLTTAEKNLEKTKCYANFDGVVVSVKVDEGDYAKAGAAVVTVIDNTKLKATVEIDEIDAQLLYPSARAVLTSDSVSGVKFEGEVSYIPLVGRYSNNGIGVLDVEILISNPPEGLKSGFSFSGTISVESEKSMLLITKDAVSSRNGDNYVMKKLADGTTREVQVEIKYLGENTYQILAGDIKAGDKVVYDVTESVRLFSGMGGMGMGASSPGGRR